MNLRQLRHLPRVQVAKVEILSERYIVMLQSFNAIYVLLPLGFVLGTIFGSFVSMASYRWLRNESWGGRSKCPACGRTLGILDLVPIFSWFMLGKQCSCGAPISMRYPMIEAITGILFAITLAHFGLTSSGALACGFVVLIMLIIVIDWENFIIPNRLVMIMLLTGLLWRLARDGVWFAPFLGIGAGVMLFLTAFLAAWVVERVCEIESLGGGDLKLLFAAGPWVGFPMLPGLLIFSGLYGMLFNELWKRINLPAKQSADVPFGAFPFGPSICMAILTCLLTEDFFMTLFAP